MVLTPLKTRLTALEARLPAALHTLIVHFDLITTFFGQLLFLSMDMLHLALAAWFGVVHRHGARCCYRAGNAETAC